VALCGIGVIRGASALVVLVIVDAFLANKRRYNMKTKNFIYSGVSLLMIACLIFPISCDDEEPTPTSIAEPEIPTHYSTYIEEGLFSISYPPEWETALFLIEDVEEYVKEVINSIESDTPVEKSNFIFAAGLPTEDGYVPNVVITVGSLPGVTWKHDEVVEASIENMRIYCQDHDEFSRVKTTIGGSEATIIDWQASITDTGQFHYISMITLVGKTCWVITCTAFPDEYRDCKDDFNSIVRSLRILN